MNGTLASALTAGLGTGLALIVAIGAQNAFVLRQGILRQHLVAVVVVCSLSDIVLIGLGIAGVGSVIRHWPAALTVVAVVGATFLLVYGALAARRALRFSGSSGSSAMATSDDATGRPLRTVALTCLALTWLNPHVYLDTVLMLGSVGNGFGPLRWWFAAGAAAGSLLWFTALGYGARLLSGLFARPRSWQVLDGLIAVTMTGLGITMLVGALG